MFLYEQYCNQKCRNEDVYFVSTKPDKKARYYNICPFEFAEDMKRDRNKKTSSCVRSEMCERMIKGIFSIPDVIPQSYEDNEEYKDFVALLMKDKIIY